MGRAKVNGTEMHLPIVSKQDLEQRLVRREIKKQNSIELFQDANLRLDYVRVATDIVYHDQYIEFGFDDGFVFTLKSEQGCRRGGSYELQKTTAGFYCKEERPAGFFRDINRDSCQDYFDMCFWSEEHLEKIRKHVEIVSEFQLYFYFFEGTNAYDEPGLSDVLKAASVAKNISEVIEQHKHEPGSIRNYNRDPVPKLSGFNSQKYMVIYSE